MNVQINVSLDNKIVETWFGDVVEVVDVLVEIFVKYPDAVIDVHRDDA